MHKLTRNNLLMISAISLFFGAIGPWITVLGVVSVGPTNSLEVGLMVFGGIGLVILSALTSHFMRPISIVVGLLILAEAINVFARESSSEASDWISPGWGLYLTIVTCVFLIVSTFLVKETLMEKYNIRSIDVARIDEDIASPYGRCDTCGSPCDKMGCMNNRRHDVAIGV